MKDFAIDATATPAERENELERPVLEGLQLVRQALAKAAAKAAPDCKEIIVNLSEEGQFAPSDWVIEEIGTRLQALNHDWLIMIFNGVAPVITCDRKRNSTTPTKQAAGALNINALLDQRKIELEPLVLGELDVVRRTFAQAGPQESAIIIHLSPVERSSTNTWILMEVARRTQALNHDWFIMTFDGVARVITCDRKSNSTMPTKQAAGTLNINSVLDQRKIAQDTAFTSGFAVMS